MAFFSSNRYSENRSALGTLEARVMEVLWLRGESSVRDVSETIDRPLAYTTIMTTLERLFKKGLLKRCRTGRAFLYSPAINREEWQRQRAGGLVAAFLDGHIASRELLVSSLLDAIGHHDAALLEELEKKIRLRRKQLADRSRS